MARAISCACADNHQVYHSQPERKPLNLRQRTTAALRGIVLLTLSFAWFAHNVETEDFDKAPTGVAPKSWTFPNTHRGEPGRWIVHPDTTAPSRPNVLAQLTAFKVSDEFAVALNDRGDCVDGDLSVNLKMVSGKNSQTAGLIWRYQDPKNFYALLVDAIGDKLTVDKTVDGKSSMVTATSGSGKISSVSHRIDPQEWNLIKIVYRDQHATIFFNHRKLLEVDDSANLKAGKTGIWTKGDTVAYFDDFRIDKKK